MKEPDEWHSQSSIQTVSLQTIFVWLMDHEPKTHFLMVIVGFEQTLQKESNYGELKISGEKCHWCMRNSEAFLGYEMLATNIDVSTF